jgi:hypothetical protein
MICESQLKEPITHEDLQDHEEYLEQAALTIKALFDRCRYQYNGDTPVSTYLWNIYSKIDQAHTELAALRATNQFPSGG